MMDMLLYTACCVWLSVIPRGKYGFMGQACELKTVNAVKGHC